MIIPLEYFQDQQTINLLKENFGITNILTIPGWFPLKKHFGQETYSIEDCIESLRFYRTNEKIILSSISEGFVIDLLSQYDKIVRSLLEDITFSTHDFFYLSSALPTNLNIIAYNNICSRNNFIKTNLILTNHFEVRIKGKFNKLENYDYKFNMSCLEKIKQKKFISFNGVTRKHRTYFSMLLIGKNLLESSYFSYALNYNASEIQAKNLISNSDSSISSSSMDTIRDIYSKNYNRFPMFLSKKPEIWEDIFVEDFKLFNNSYFNLIMETCFFSDKNSNEAFNFEEVKFITEKTFRGFVFPIPFIVLNRPGCLSALHEYGYKTFHPYIDESYDNIEDDEKRMLAVLDEVERLCNLTDEEWLKIQSALNPVFMHNYKKIMNSTDFSIMSKV